MNMNKFVGHKRKRDIVEELHGTSTKASLRVSVPEALPCDICKQPVITYRTQANIILCSFDCYSVYLLSQSNKLLHEEMNEKTFEENNKDNLMNLDKQNYKA